MSLRRALRLVALLTALGLATLSLPAYAAEGSIDHVETVNAKMQVLYSLPDAGSAQPDLGSLKVSLGQTQLDAEATLASEASDAVRRTAVLAVDVSNSMRADAKFAEAKRAAQIFLDSAPKDLYVGIVTFAGTVRVAQQPTLDRTAPAKVLEGLQLSQGTFLYDGLRQAIRSSGTEGQRSVIVLSDGRDHSTTKLATVTKAVKKADVKVDVVALAQSSADQARLEPLTSSGGAVIDAKDPKALGRVFASEAETLAKQVQITAAPPAGTTEGTLAVSVDAGGQTYTDSAFVTLGSAAKPKPATNRLRPAPVARTLPPKLMLAGIGGIGLACLIVIVGVFGGLGKRKESLESRIEAYTTRGAGKRAAPAAATQGSVATQAVGLATRALESRGLEAKLGKKLEGAALSFQPAEWLLLHAAIAFGASAAAFLLAGGSLAMAGAGFIGGALLTWMYLGFKQARRLKAFNAQLAGTLQLMAGSLQAGLSFAQGLDTIVREGAEPIAGEFRRALVETRLGVTVENALDGIAERMTSDDFGWTVMAIRIQREVGGNLAELLLSVAATLRERDYLRRQVKSLSAEGRFSAYILLALPPGVMFYEYLTNRSYLEPLYTTSVGFVMLGVMVALMGIGSFMMKRMIKLEV